MIERVVKIALPPEVHKEVKVYMTEKDPISLYVLEKNIEGVLFMLHNEKIIDVYSDTITVEFEPDDKMVNDNKPRKVRVIKHLWDNQDEYVVGRSEEEYTVEVYYQNNN
jgi:hypothetical protein